MNAQTESLSGEDLDHSKILTEKQIADHDARTQAGIRAAAAPFPGPLREAFATDPPQLKFGDQTFILQPVTCALICLLERVNNRFLEMVGLIQEYYAKVAENNGPLGDSLEKIIRNKMNLKTEEIIEACYIFTTPIEELEKLMANPGFCTLRGLAVRELGRRVHPMELGELSSACILHFANSFSTRLEYRSAAPEGGAINFPAAPGTASAGG